MEEKSKPDIRVFEQMFRDVYDMEGATLIPLPRSYIPDERALFEVQSSDGNRCVLRVTRLDAPVPNWLVGCDADTQEALLVSRAATLHFLEQHAFPAPRIARTRAGAAIGVAQGWCTLLTTYIEGVVSDLAPRSLFAVGRYLAQLHNLGTEDYSLQATHVGKSWWYGETAIPGTLGHYAALGSDVPAEWRPLISGCVATLQRFASTPLPTTLIHGDAWAGNVVQQPSGDAVLIDWDPSGLGFGIIDLGRLLLYGHWELAHSLDAPILPSAWRVNAILEGYTRERTLSQLESDLLLDAIRFGIAAGAASHFLVAQQHGWQDQWLGRLRRRKHWYAVSEQIADLARTYLASNQ